MNKKYLLPLIIIFMMLFQSTIINAQVGFFTISAGGTLERDVFIHNKDSFKSNNTISVDLGLMYFADEDLFGYGIAMGMGVKSVELSSMSDILEGDSRKGGVEFNLGPALYFGDIEEGVSLVVTAQPGYWIGKLLTSENSVIVGNWGVKLTADLKIGFLALGVSYNPSTMKLYKSNTDTNLFSSYNNSAMIRAKPAVEFRIGAFIGPFD